MNDPTTTNPILLTGDRRVGVEIEHRGAIAVVHADGTTETLGSVSREVFLRSAAKFFQALCVVDSGAADRFQLTDAELALMCASHSSQRIHLEVAREMLRKGGFRESDLFCAGHAPLDPLVAARMRVNGEEPGRLHNNCSGKHAGMMLGAATAGFEPKGYADPDHPWQRLIRDRLAGHAGLDVLEVRHGTDGCGVPAFFLPLISAAQAFCSFAQRAGKDAASSEARLVRAVRNEPLMIAGEGRFCTAVARYAGGDTVVKIGADGFYGGIVPALGIGFALHVDDGSWNASERIAAGVLDRYGLLDDAAHAELEPFCSPVRRNCAGIEIGRMKLRLDGLANGGAPQVKEARDR